MPLPENVPDIVIRPAGVWDTRAPLFQFIAYHRIENQIYSALVMGINKLVCEARQEDSDQVASRFFNPKKAGQMASRAWISYKNSFPQNALGQRSSPTVRNACDSLLSSIPSITEYAIVSYCGVFETYVQCWALNFLLARLESGVEWTSKERRLARAFSPLSSEQLPSFYQICEAIPVIKETLSQLPHVFVNPTTGEAVDAPITPNLNVFQAVSFWRDWRNLLVHASGMVNLRFRRKHEMFWNDFKRVFPHIKDIEVGKRLSLNDATFRALTTSHYRAAKSLRAVLVAVSSERRGHIRAPGPASESGRVSPEEVPERVPPMLMNGDQEFSYKWVSDGSFRQSMGPILAGTSQGGRITNGSTRTW